jgi:hypothetical protein
MQTPYMMVGFLRADEDMGVNSDGQSKLSLQRFPGPYKYAMMQAFLQALATHIGYVRPLYGPCVHVS